MRASEALHGKRTFRCNQNTDFLARQEGAEQLVERLKHQSRTKLGNRAKHVDPPAARPSHLLSNTEITMKRVRGLGPGQDCCAAIDHRSPPWCARVTSKNPQNAQAPLDPAVRVSPQHARDGRSPQISCGMRCSNPRR